MKHPLRTACECLFLFLGLFATNLPAATNRWTGAGNNGLWNTAANWSLNSVPASDHDVVIDLPGIYSVVVTNGTSVASLTLGTNSGQQTLQMMQWTSMEVGKGTIRASGQLQLSWYTDFTVAAGFLNSGKINAGGGGYGVEMIRANGSFTNAGTLSADTETELRLEGNYHFVEGSTIVGEGTVSSSANISGPGPVILNGRYVIFAGSIVAGLRWEGPGLLELWGGSFTGLGNGNGIRTNVFGASLQVIVDGYPSIDGNSVLENHGTFLLRGGQIDGGSAGLLVNHGTIEVEVDDWTGYVLNLPVKNFGTVKAYGESLSGHWSPLYCQYPLQTPEHYQVT